MAYIGQGLDRFSNVEKLDAITPATSTGAGPYNLTKGSVAFTPSSANTMVVSIDGVIQYGNFSVSGSTITFNAALADANTCDFIYHMGTGLLSTPVDNSVSTVKIVDSNVTDAKIATVAASKLTGALPAISGANLTNLPAETKPSVDSISPTVITNAQTAVTITGTNFISVPQVEAINSTGAITAADSITYTSATQIVATFTLPTDGTYFLRVENNDGNAARSSSALLNVSDLPAWVTAAGSLGSFAGGSAIATQTLTCTDAVSFTVSPSPIATGLTFATGVGSCTITGTQTQHTSAATSNFTVTATDAQGQTSPRAFSMSWTFGATGSGGFN
jgi:hypothetical protein